MAKNCCEYINVVNMMFKIEKDGAYYYIINDYDTPICLFALNIDPTKGFRNKENLQIFLYNKLRIFANKILKEIK